MNSSEIEFKTTSTLKESKNPDGCEMLIINFDLFFGELELCIIATIPEQNETSAPVYVKIRKKIKHKNAKH